MSTEQKATEMVREATKRIRQELPQKMAIVKCPKFRCLGILGEDGVWRDGQNQALEVLEVVAEF